MQAGKRLNILLVVASKRRKYISGEIKYPQISAALIKKDTSCVLTWYVLSAVIAPRPACLEIIFTLMAARLPHKWLFAISLYSGDRINQVLIRERETRDGGKEGGSSRWAASVCESKRDGGEGVWGPVVWGEDGGQKRDIHVTGMTKKAIPSDGGRRGRPVTWEKRDREPLTSKTLFPLVPSLSPSCRGVRWLHLTFSSRRFLRLLWAQTKGSQVTTPRVTPDDIYNLFRWYFVSRLTSRGWRTRKRGRRCDKIRNQL